MLKSTSLVTRGFAAIGVVSLLMLGFQNCAQPNSIQALDQAGASTPPGPVVQVNLATNISVPQAAWTKIPMDTVEIDTDNFYDAANSRIYPTKAGIYRVHLNLLFSMTGTAGFTIYIAIFKNGAINRQIHNLINYTSGFNQTLQADALIPMNGVSDYLEAYAYINSGTGAIINGPASSWMSAEYLRAQ